MSEGLSAVMARISQIETLISPASSASTGSTATSGSAFQNTLDQLGSGTATSADGDGSGSIPLGDQAVALASKYIGTPYRWGGTDPSTGLDCSGFTQLVYKQLGVDLPRTSAEQAQTGTAVASLSQAQPGDLLFFGSPVHHVGIYLGAGKMIDAPRTGEKVKIQTVYETPSQIRRVLPADPGTGTASSAVGLSNSALASLLNSIPTPGSSTGSLGNTPYAALFTAAGQRYGVDPALLSAMAKTESSYNPDAVSGAGAVGLMQLMPGTARSLGVNPKDPAQAVAGAARIMSDNLRTFHGRVDLALAAYNAGAGAVRKYNGVPPYPETQNYVKKVQKYWGELR